MEFTLEDISDEEIMRRRALYEPFTDSVRDLIDAVIRTEVDDATVRQAQAEIAGVVQRLRTQQMDGAYGVRYTADKKGMAWGNAVIGLRNAIAPPLVLRPGDDGGVVTDATLGAAYEGPSGLVHGGVCAMLFDHVLGEAASVDGIPCFTGTISVRYLRPTPLGPIRIDAAISGRDGRKKIVRGTLSGPDGVTAEAEGIFIVPREFEGQAFSSWVS
ncbi:PaaI family thioesterase [Gordonia soli]|nr:PaaI family thioesterase [Gordonia soli]